MSGASANAAARRRRAAPNTISQSQQKRNSQQAQNVKGNMNTIISNDLQQSSVQSNPRTPVEMLKNVYQRMNKAEGILNEIKGSSDNQVSFNKKMDMMKDKISEFEHTLKRIDEFEKSISDIDEKVNKLVELCAKIQTFAMESKTSFLLFKNNFDAKLIQQSEPSDCGSGRGIRNELSVEDFDPEDDENDENDENEVVELNDGENLIIDSEELEMEVEMDMDVDVDAQDDNLYNSNSESEQEMNVDANEELKDELEEESNNDESNSVMENTDKNEEIVTEEPTVEEV